MDHQHHQHAGHAGHDVETTTKIDNSCCDTGTQATSTGEHMMHHMMSVSS